ncbi:hypothetical protein WCWAEYFT_CDS0023 [Vibrio phage VB_VaC_TDDLMA]
MSNPSINPINHYQNQVQKIHDMVESIGFTLDEVCSGEWENTYQILDGEKVVFTTKAITITSARPQIRSFVEGYKYRDKEAWDI